MGRIRMSSTQLTEDRLLSPRPAREGRLTREFWLNRIQFIITAMIPCFLPSTVQKAGDGWEEVTGRQADMFHALGRFIFERQFWQNMVHYGTSEYCA